jgi:hypothetical protein
MSRKPLLPARLTWEDRDRHRWLGALAASGLAAGVLMAVFGLPPVDLHGPLHYVGIMDPLCGGTRGVHATLRGEFGQAWRYNPLSVLLVGGAGAALARQATGMITGHWLNVQIVRHRTALIILLVLAGLLEINQQAHADLLRAPGERFSPLGMMINLAVAGTAAAVASWRLHHRASPATGTS